MPNKGEEGKANTLPTETSPEAGEAVTHKRLRPRWQRWFMWTSVRLLLLMGVGAGVGTVQWRRRPPDLMTHARRIASIANASGYYWTTKGELRLYRHGGKGTASLKWDQATQTATFIEMLKPLKGQLFAEPMRDIGPHVQTVAWQDAQTRIVGAYKQEQNYTRGKLMPRPDYTWKIKVIPNMPSSFNESALSPDGQRIAYKCLVPRMDWRDEIRRRFQRGYQAPFRGQGSAILISAVDGSRTEVLGTLKDDMPNTHTQYSRSGMTASLQAIFWCQDGKHLSFEYGDGVYEVPVK